ncbi:MAG: AMP-binding protein [Deltaproteobacteria bacterium]|nr:AMP-binding protein [Deltaproteobacteria bacterium]
MTSIPHPLASAAAWRPRHPLLVTRDEVISAIELEDRVARVAGGLQAQCVQANDVVAVAGVPGAPFVVTMLAVSWLGATALLLDSRSPRAELLRKLRAAGVRRVVGIDALDPDFESLSVAPRHPAPERFWPLDETRFLIATSGSTGEPKLVSLKTSQLVFSAFGSALRLGHDPQDRWLCCLPLEHIGGLSVLLRCLFYGTTAVLHERFEARSVADSLDSGAVTLVSLVPTMLERVLDARIESGTDRPFHERLRAILLGGAPASDRLIERAKRILAPVAVTFGMSEAASQIATSDPGDMTPGLPPLAFARVAVAADGTLVVKGPLVDEELSTSDLVELVDGRVLVRGRVGDLINSGGTKIDPRTVEAALGAHPAVVAALVFGVDDVELGQAPAALVVTSTPVSASDLQTHCASIISRRAIPKIIERVETIPLGPSGKPSRRLARESLGQFIGSLKSDLKCPASGGDQNV